MISLDGTPNKARLAPMRLRIIGPARRRPTRRACLFYLGGPGYRTLPVLMMNILNGGAHSDNNVDPQEFMIMPVGATDFPMPCAWAQRYSTISRRFSKTRDWPLPLAMRVDLPNLAQR